MILADKIIMLRKKSGWSQEELADKLNVTRQSVSKWEGAQSIPDLNKILLMSQIFGVTTDYLLKDEIEEETLIDNEKQSEESVRRVSMEEANEFLKVEAWAAERTAWATFLCIISPVCLIILAVGSDEGRIFINENAVAGIGVSILLFLIAVAVAIYIRCDAETKPYKYLEREFFETEYGVTGMVKDRKQEYKDTYTRYNIIGTCCCILSAVPILTVLIFTENEYAVAMSVGILLLLVATGVRFFVVAGTRWGSMEKLLQEGDYTIENKKKAPFLNTVGGIYWLTVTAIFLGFGFYTDDWGKFSYIWPIAGVLFAVVMIICKAIKGRETE